MAHYKSWASHSKLHICLYKCVKDIVTFTGEEVLKPDFIFIILSILSQAGAVYFSKVAALTSGSQSIFYIFTNFYYFASLGCLGIQAIFWAIVLKKFPLFYSYLFMSLIYPIILLISKLAFNAHITAHNTIGIVIIMACIALSGFKPDNETNV